VLIIRKWSFSILGTILILIFLFTGPLAINYIFCAETTGWNFKLTFSAGEMLQYYGAVLSGLITCFAIITTVRINNKNRKQDLQRQQFERTYAVYHKLPEILAKLELTAIHVQYSVNLKEDKLIETLETMKESESILREHHYANDAHYKSGIESLLKKIISISVKCQENVEHYLQDKQIEWKDSSAAHRAMEEAFAELRESITDAKSVITAEINQFVSVYERRR